MSDASDFHGGVTDDDIAKFFTENPDFDVLQPLAPAADGEPGQSDPAPVPPVDPPADSPDPALDGQPASTPAESEGDETPPPDTEGDDILGGIASDTGPDDGPSDYLIDGRSVSADLVRRALELGDAIRTDPVLQQMVAHYFAGGGAAVPSPATAPPPAAPAATDPNAIPEDVDLDDPTIKFLYDAHQQTAAQLAQVTGVLQQTLAANERAARETSDSLYRQASETFRDAHGLTDDDVQILAKTAAGLNILPALMSGIDPVTQLPSRADPLAAINRALEIAYFATPEYRDRAIVDETARQAARDTKRRKLAAVGGNSGSVARSTPAPTTEQGRRDAMLREVGEMMTGNWTGTDQ